MTPRDGLRRLLVDGRDVAACEVAATAWRRGRGLLGRRCWPESLLLVPATSVHGVGMTRAADVALLDRDLRVVAALRLRPFGVTRPRRGVRQVLEAPAGSFARWGLVEGSRLALVPPL